MLTQNLLSTRTQNDRKQKKTALVALHSTLPLWAWSLLLDWLPQNEFDLTSFKTCHRRSPLPEMREKKILLPASGATSACSGRHRS